MTATQPEHRCCHLQSRHIFPTKVGAAHWSILSSCFCSSHHKNLHYQKPQPSAAFPSYLPCTLPMAQLIQMQCLLVHQHESDRSRSSSLDHQLLGCDLQGQSKCRCNSLLGRQHHPSSDPGGTYRDTGILEQLSNQRPFKKSRNTHTHSLIMSLSHSDSCIQVEDSIFQSKTQQPKVEAAIKHHSKKKPRQRTTVRQFAQQTC